MVKTGNRLEDLYIEEQDIKDIIERQLKNAPEECIGFTLLCFLNGRR